MRSQFTKKVVDNNEVILDKWMKSIESMKEEGHTARISDTLFEATNQEFGQVIFNSIRDGGSVQNFEEFAEKLINLGWPLGYITEGLQEF